MDSRVIISISFCPIAKFTDCPTEEFNKYLSYVRNLGFEDTPDYDYLRDLLTQALKNSGDVEDGDYDWMKLNNGKGWEAMKQHPSIAHLHHSSGVPNTSQRDIHNNRASKNPVPPGRLDAELPKPGTSRAGPGQPSTARLQPRKEPNQYHSNMNKRKSVADLAPPPEGSTMAQFQNSTQNLHTRQSMAPPPPMNAPPTLGQNGSPRGASEPKRTTWQRIAKIFCCGG